MKNRSQQVIAVVLGVLLCTSAIAQDKPKVRVVDPYAGKKPPASATSQTANTKPANEVEYVSYLLGLNMGVALKQQAMPINLQWLVNGIVDAFSNRSRLSQAELQKAQQMHDNLIKQKAALMQKNKAAAEGYLAENKKKDGVTTLESGLQYQVFEAGKGTRPGPKDKIIIKYTGRLIDGKEFLKPSDLTLSLKDVSVKGLHQGLSLMNAGAKWQLTIPPKLGYGQAISNNVPPFSVLIVDVEMVSIEPAAEVEKAPANQSDK